MARIKCPVCGGRTDEGAFCEKCGVPLGGMCVCASGQTEPVSPEASLDETPTSGSVIAEVPDTQAPRVIVLTSKENHREAEQSAPVQTSQTDPVAEMEDFDECPWLRMERDTVVFCVADAPGLLRLRLTPLTDGLHNLHAEITLFGVTGAVVQPVKWFRPHAGKSGEFSLTVPPLKQGAYGAELTVRFSRAGVIQKYVASLELYVYPSASSAKQIAESIVININNDIKMGHASDMHQSLDAASALGHMAGNGQTHGLTELLNLTRSEIRSYRRINLFEDDVPIGCEMPPPPVGARMDRITLVADGRRLHLIAGNRVTFGRNRANRIVTRLFGQTSEETARLNGRISKFHCMLMLDGNDCAIHDGALDETDRMRPSSWGVFWRKMPVKECVRFPLEKFPASAELGLAGTASVSDFSLMTSGCFFDPARCAACDPSRQRICRKGKVPSILLKRTDDVPECFVLLWSCFDLGAVFPDCSGVAVCCEQGAFSWRSGTGAGWLTPGMTLAGGVDVRPFQQVGL